MVMMPTSMIFNNVYIFVGGMFLTFLALFYTNTKEK